MGYYHPQKWFTPTYFTISVSQMLHNNKSYVMGVYSDLDETYIGVGEGLSKKSKEQQAAKKCIDKCKIFSSVRDSNG